MSIAIEAIAAHIPKDHLSNIERAAEFGIDEKFIAQKLGVEKVSRMAPNDDTADLAERAVRALGDRFQPADIECLVVCTQNPHGHGIPHTSAVLHGRLGLTDHCACFDIGLGCSGYVYSLSVVSAFMQSNGFSKGLLVTCDPYSKILNPADRNTIMLFGDGATVTLLSPEGQLVPTLFEFATRGADGPALHNDSGELFMNGRAVFNFSNTRVPEQIRKLLHRAELTVDDVDWFIFHQGSRFIVDQLTRRLKVPPEKVPLRLLEHGNTVSSTIPLLLQEYLNGSAGHRFLLSGFGVGLSWASCLLERRYD
jgi:3-oxoacyl-[acyl-carrier-protein] synthase-3